jgi:hypothetical protein
MKYLSLLLLGSSLVAGARTGNAGANAGNSNAGNGNAGNAGANAGNNNGNGNANTGMTAQGSSNGQMQAGGIVNGGMNTGNSGATGATGTTTSSAPGNAVSAANVPPGANPFVAVGNSTGSNGMQFPTLTATQKMGLQMAANLWAQDTAVVSSALSLLGSGNMTDQDFRDVADMAYMAEVNELMQKNYIDALLGTMPQLQAASTSLGNGSFAIVVDQLREMRIRGQANQTFVQAAVQGMNNLRCRQVLLAIDTYVQTANQAAGNTSFISATRPPACKQVYAQTADTLPAGSVTNATTFPNAAQLITQFNQAPRFMLSNAVAFKQNSGSDNTPALGSQYTTNPPFTNTSSLSGQLLAFQGKPVMTNGAASNIQANPLNGVLFSNIANNNTSSSNTGNSNNGNSTTTGTTTGNNSTTTTGQSGGKGNTTTTGATGQSGSTGQTGNGNGKGGAGAQSGNGKGANAGGKGQNRMFRMFRA